MNRSVDAQVKDAESDNTSATARFSSWPVLIAILVYPLMYGMGASGSVLLSLLGSTLAYLLAVYLYQGIPAVMSRGRWKLTMAALVVALVIGLALTPSQFAAMYAVSLVTIAMVGVVVGVMAKRESSQLRLYLYGLIVTAIGAIAIWSPNWSMIIEGAESLGTEMMEEALAMSGGGGMSEEQLAQFRESARRMFAMIGYLSPVGTVMTTVMQFSLGFLWFMHRTIPADAPAGRLRPFTQWRVPFALMPVLIVVGLLRLVGGDMLTLAMDNLLVAASLFYCVTGLALLEFALQKIKLNLGVKIVFYILMVFTGLIGYLGMVLLGFLDSFFDWRKPREKDAQTT
ncbi:DUF2232 domain-containing protein [candidate division GN15 bacterium]|nr:DUF2232 domain-containing protein [candidate division GN15 bacterium]